VSKGSKTSNGVPARGYFEGAYQASHGVHGLPQTGTPHLGLLGCPGERLRRLLERPWLSRLLERRVIARAFQGRCKAHLEPPSPGCLEHPVNLDDHDNLTDHSPYLPSLPTSCENFHWFTHLGTEERPGRPGGPRMSMSLPPPDSRSNLPTYREKFFTRNTHCNSGLRLVSVTLSVEIANHDLTLTSLTASPWAGPPSGYGRVG